MPFDSFARDFFDNWNDVGVVYTRNKYGRVSSPPGYGLKEKNDLSGFTKSLFKGKAKPLGLAVTCCQTLQPFVR